MSEKFTHGKIKTHYVNEDGSITSDTESFYENPTAFERDISHSVRTGRDTFLADVMQSLNLISNKMTRELTLTIKADEHYMPRQIVKTWTETKEVLDKKR